MKIFMLTATILVAGLAGRGYTQPTPPQNPQNNPDAVPIAGIEYLLLAGVVYGAYRLNKKARYRTPYRCIAGLTFFAFSAHSQIVTSANNGVWNDPLTWSGGVIPTSVNSTQIIVDHEVVLPAGFSVAAYRLLVNNKLTLSNGGVLTILEDALVTVPDFLVTGTLVNEDGAVLNGTTAINTSFDSGATYIHRQGPLGFIPLATWHSNSTMIIAGFKGSGYINIAHSEGWKQNFGHVVYDCPWQTIFVVDLNGYLRNIAGDFTIRNTNNQTLRLSTTQNPAIRIGGSLVVQGSSEVWFSTNGTTTSVDIQNDFVYRSSSSGPSYFSTRGICTVNVGGNFEMDSPGPLRMTSSTADSVGARQATLNLSGDLKIYSGTIIAPPLGSGKGTIVFKGTGTQTVVSSALGSSFLGNLDHRIENTSTVSLGNSVLSNTTGMLHVKGKIQLGSTDTGGAIQLINKGNIHIPGQRIFEPGSVIEYNGISPQWIGNGHPSGSGISLVCNNPATITVAQDVIADDFFLQQGAVLGALYSISLHGDMNLQAGVAFQPGLVNLIGVNDQHISAAGLTIKDLTISKPGNSQVTLLSPLNLSGILSIISGNTRFNANGFLTLLSSSDVAGGTARVGSLAAGSSILGNVTYQRYMRGEGRIYRYISSPVENATIASLMDDFPVTGAFADPSSGPGINSTAPSLYQYDESKGTLSAGWQPYPVSGLASETLLETGKGYAAFIRNGTGATIWDVTGRLNQGDISLPVNFSPDGAPSNGWNLVGNPYACTIDWDVTGAGGWIKQNISPVICLRDNGVGGGGTFLYWDGDINYNDIPNGQIASGQSFWVRATGANPVLTIREGVKVTNDAAFYRTVEAQIPSLALVLTRDGLTDKAYFKIRQDAKEELDDWDAVKLENDQFDISTLLPDRTSLAINAQRQLPCHSKTIQIGLKDLSMGTYLLSLATKLAFTNFTYTLVDHYLQRETTLSAAGSTEIIVTEDPASAAFERFSLRLDEVIPDRNVQVSAPRTVCEHGSVDVVVRASQEGIHYALWTNAGEQVSGERVGDGKDLRIRLHADSLEHGENIVVVSARAVCQQVMLLNKVLISKEIAPTLWVDNLDRSADGAVTLRALSASEDVLFTWFETDYSRDTLGRTAEWVTPQFKKRTTYYVSGTSSSGCVSKRYPVVAEIKGNSGARILFNTIDSQLTSGYGLSSGIGIAVYPNPTSGDLYIPDIGGEIRGIQIINSVGVNVLRFEGAALADDNGLKRIDVGVLPEGAYLALIKGQNLFRIARFIKIDK